MERLEAFYTMHFQAKVLFRHTAGDFRCTFISVCDGAVIELMTRTGLPKGDIQERVGYSHLSIEVESREEVNRLTKYFRSQNVPIEKDLVQYDDGFYESSIRDPDGNIIELAYVDRIANPSV